MQKFEVLLRTTALLPHPHPCLKLYLGGGDVITISKICKYALELYIAQLIDYSTIFLRR